MVYFSRMSLLTVEGISRQEHGIFSLRDISFSLEPFQKIAITGETGSGKTSLLKIIAGLLQPTAGWVIFEGKRVLGPDEKLMPGHPAINYLSQHFELRNNYRVEDELEAKNIMAPEEAAKIFSVCRVEHLLKRMTSQLSGGEKQRIALARVLISTPRLLLLDEPFSNLDMGHKQVIKQVVKDISEELGITVMMVLHDAPDILSWADTILVMQEGRIIQDGTPEEIYRHPVNEYCGSLFGMYNLVDPSAGFASFSRPAGKDKKLFFRPEDVHIANGEENSVSGIVEGISYWGSYHTMDINVDGQLICVQIKKPPFGKGDLVQLSLPEEAIWFL